MAVPSRTELALRQGQAEGPRIDTKTLLATQVRASVSNALRKGGQSQVVVVMPECNSCAMRHIDFAALASKRWKSPLFVFSDNPGKPLRRQIERLKGRILVDRQQLSFEKTAYLAAPLALYVDARHTVSAVGVGDIESGVFYRGARG